MGYQILQIFKLERVQNAAARLIRDISKFSRVTVLLSMNFIGFLLRVYQIKFKILTLTFKSIHGLVPSNLSDLIKVKQLAHEQLFLKPNFSWQNAIQRPLFWFSKPVLFATSGL